MSLTQIQQDALAETFQRPESSLSGRERACALTGGVLFAAAVAALLSVRPPGSTHPLAVLLCVLVLAVAYSVQIDLPLGFTVPTQLAFVPLVFAAPPAVVPLLVVAALFLAAIVDVALGRMKPARLAGLPMNSAFALGPAAVFSLAGISPLHASPGLLLAALGAQIAVDVLVSTMRLIFEQAGELASQLRDMWVYVVDIGLSLSAVFIARDVVRTPVVVLTLLPLLALLWILSQERRRRLQGTLELSAAYRGTALVLGDVVEADDGYTGYHSKSVVALALEVGAELGLDGERMRNLEFGALLHDVGKIAIPKAIINKPGKLDPQEWRIIKTHTVEGQRMLDRVGGFMRQVGLIVRSHHERWDGGGYPDGLAAAAIPIEARIVSCCDAWNAMRTNRAYRQALSYEMACAELLNGAGTQFDPTVVDALLRVVEPDERTAEVPARAVAPSQPAAAVTIAV